MDWDAIGAIGEILGSLGVLVTLIYLATQIRQNSKLLRKTSRQFTAENSQSVFDMVQEPFTRTAVFKAFHEDSEISFEESVVVEAFLVGAINQFFNQYRDYQEGDISDEDWKRTSQQIGFWFTTAWPKAWWEFGRLQYPADFVEIVDDSINSIPLAGGHLPEVVARASQIRRDGFATD